LGKRPFDVRKLLIEQKIVAKYTKLGLLSVAQTDVTE